VTGRFIHYPDLAARIAEEGAAGAALLVGVDGPGASGKSTLARHLASHLGAHGGPKGARHASSAALVHVDDFYQPARKRFQGSVAERPVGADFDRERLAREVLTPLRAGLPARYRRYDWSSDALEPGDTIAVGPRVVVEGVYATSAPLRAFYDVTLWVECPRNLRLERGLARDGAAAAPRWLDWMAGEDLYIARENPRQHATFVCDGSHGRADQGVWLLDGSYSP